MTRYISFIILFAILLAIAVLFFRVMWGFVLPLFVALVLVMVFRPLHLWMLHRCRGSEYLAAGLTTTVIVAVVVAPLGWVFTAAGLEVWRAAGSFDVDEFLDRAAATRKRFGLEMPLPDDFKAIDDSFDSLENLPNNGPISTAAHQDEVAELLQRWWVLKHKLDDAENPSVADPAADDRPWREVDPLGGVVKIGSGPPQPLWLNANAQYLLQNPQAVAEMLEPEASDAESTLAPAERGEEQLVEPPPMVADMPLDAPAVEEPPEASPSPPQEPSIPPEYQELLALPEMQRLLANEAVVDFWDDTMVQRLTELADTRIDNSEYSEYRNKLRAAKAAYRALQYDELGSPVRVWLLDMVNPSEAEINQIRDGAINYLEQGVWTTAGITTQLLTDLMISGGIMILAIFYFFADGPRMVSSLMQLSPLDDRYERALLEQFDAMSRAVVVANLVNALVQGILSYIGYIIAGADLALVLSVVTMVLALIPIIGAASVWTPVCIWLYLYDGNVGGAIFLLIYGSTVLTAVDYLLRPFLLHGQANLHPLLGFMSVIGGMQALGPIGVIVGPMVTMFLQTLLIMLQSELSSIEQDNEEQSRRESDGLALADTG